MYKLTLRNSPHFGIYVIREWKRHLSVMRFSHFQNTIKRTYKLKCHQETAYNVEKAKDLSQTCGMAFRYHDIKVTRIYLSYP